MHLWIVERTDGYMDYEETGSVLIRAETEDDALYLVCGGPNPEYPDLRVMDRWPLQGYKQDRSNAVARILAVEGEPGILLAESRGA